MYRVSMQNQSLWRELLLSKVGLVFIVAFFCASLSLASAQTEDSTQPTLTAFSFTPTTIDTSAGQAVVVVSFSATDDLTGVNSVQARFESPSGQQVSFAYSNLTPALSVSITADAIFPQFSETGIWTVSAARVTDVAGNNRFYPAAELAQLGFPSALRVVGQQADVTPPVIAITATPDILWPPNGKMVPVTISGTMTDAGSGVDPTTAAYAVTDEYRLDQPSGSVHVEMDGSNTFSYSFQIHLQASRQSNDRDGRQYTIIVSAKDDAGNTGSATAIVTVPHDLGQDRSIATR